MGTHVLLCRVLQIIFPAVEIQNMEYGRKWVALSGLDFFLQLELHVTTHTHKKPVSRLFSVFYVDQQQCDSIISWLHIGMFDQVIF